uniref:Odorant receptor 2 n=1 Tax=Dendroctonus ponderosae TaxID=77166 RepID=A0A0H3W582_DENPD|nr:odorant receptor 2 [Dendroctonus ponderosae]
MLYPVRKGLPFYPNLLILKLAGYYPKSSNYNKKLFFYCLFCWMLIWTGTSWNLIILLYLSIQNKTNYGFVEAMGYLLGITSFTLACLHFALKHEDWSHLMDDLMDFQKYGKPPKFNKVQTSASKLGIAFTTGFFSAAVIYAILQVLLEEKCEKLSFGNTSCGMLLPTWFPASYAENKLIKRLVLIYQVLACCTMAPYTMIVSLVLEANEFIAYRIDHLKSQLRKVGCNGDSDLFLASVQYHHDIIRQVGQTFSIYMDLCAHCVF